MVVVTVQEEEDNMQIYTGLPYDFSQMTLIAENGAIIDLSNINYPGITQEENIKTTYIYLRNTGYENIDLDFSKNDFDFKEKFLLYYLKGDIEYTLKECSNTWIKIIGLYNNQNFPVSSILTDEEIKKFINNNLDFIKDLNIFFISLPLYPISRMSFDDNTVLSLDELENTEEIVCNNSICDIISNQFFMELYDTMPQEEPMFYSNIFTIENNKLFDTLILHTPFATLLYGMCQENWSDFVKDIEKIISENENV